MKKTIAFFGFCFLVAYLFFSAFFFKDKPKENVCQDLEVVIVNDNYGSSFIESKDILRGINAKHMNPIGKSIGNVNTADLEREILSNHLIKDVHAYITDNSTIILKVIQRKPVLRVMSNSGDNYYVDSEGEKMQLLKSTAAYVPIATGAIKESFAREKLYKFALFLSGDPFWNAQVEQIVVSNNDELRLIPRVGNQQILLGNLDNYEDKLDRLMTFYQKGQNKIGWNKYSVLNLKYDKQVVCVKR